MGKRYTEEMRLADRYTQKKTGCLRLTYRINCTLSSYIVTRTQEAGTTCNVMLSTVTDVNVALTKHIYRSDSFSATLYLTLNILEF